MVHARAMLQGSAPARDDIPCTTCDIYLGMAAKGRWLKREDAARGQKLSPDEGIAVASAWRDAGRLPEAKQLCETVLRAEPGHAAALRLIYALRLSTRASA